MSVLVTGGAGYIGSVTVERLRDLGEDVVVVDDLARGYQPNLPSGTVFYEGKVADRALISRIAREHRLESCIHFAALIEVGESVLDPAKYFENNVGQGMELFSELTKHGIRRVVFSSTAAVYGDPETIPIPEQSRLWPKSPYGWSKLFMERLLASYDQAYGVKFVALRYFNAAGASQNCGERHEPETHLIPNVLAAALGELPAIRIFGDHYPTPDGTAIRDYIHVVDLANAHIRALEHLRGGGASDFLNLGTGRVFSVLEVVETARRVTGRSIAAQIEPPRAGDPVRLIADPSRAKAVLGWQPEHSDLESIVRSAWEWQLRNPRARTVRQ